jgi:hypothetical protein
VEAWDEAVDGFEAWLIEADTDPEIQYCITQTLRMRDSASLFSAYANAGSTTLSSPTLEASQEQDDIGIAISSREGYPQNGEPTKTTTTNPSVHIVHHDFGPKTSSATS